MIKRDEFKLLMFFVDKEIESYKKQLEWYKKYESHKKELIEDYEIYIHRLNDLKVKIQLEMKQ